MVTSSSILAQRYVDGRS